MKTILFSLSFCLLLLLNACSATIPKAEKINGVSFVASREAINDNQFTPQNKPVETIIKKFYTKN